MNEKDVLGLEIRVNQVQIVQNFTKSEDALTQIERNLGNLQATLVRSCRAKL